MKRQIFSSLIVLSAFTLGAQSDYYVKELVFPADADSVTKIDMVSRLVPSPAQLEWQNMELTAFLHFGMNTFTDREWGDGSESPEIFNPTDLDADQWVSTLKDAGFKMVILTAKHHDGFCLWPTATTNHSVAASPWRDGKGDVVKELSEACRRHGLKLGLYLSPWDRNAPCYGDSPAYNDMFVAQLTELLSNYGQVDEVWFDGACGEGPNGKKQEYDWTRFKQTMRTLQPTAVLAIMGDDVRWVGNEKGQGRETEWSATALTPGIYPDAAKSNEELGIFGKAPNLGGRDIVVRAHRMFWWPSEVDVSIRPGWFWHENESPKSLQKLVEIYLSSVGRNSVLLLNIPPDRTGKIDAKDVARLSELRKWINDNFSIQAAPGETVNCVVLGEDISRGQRVEEFGVEVLRDGAWQEVAAGTTIGKKRILMFEPTKADSVRLNIKSQRGQAHLLPLGAYNIVLPEAEISEAYSLLSKADWKNISSDGVITIDLNAQSPFTGFIYKPNAETDGGFIFKYRFDISDDGLAWIEVRTPGEFSNIVNNPIEQTILFEKPVSARFIRLTPLETVDNPLLSKINISLIK